MIVVNVRVEIEPAHDDLDVAIDNANQLRNALVGVVDAVADHSIDNIACSSTVERHGQMTEVPKVGDTGDGHVTFVYHNEDSNKHIPYVMNDMAAVEVNTAAVGLFDALDGVRAGTGDPLAAIEGIADWLSEIAGPV